MPGPDCSREQMLLPHPSVTSLGPQEAGPTGPLCAHVFACLVRVGHSSSIGVLKPALPLWVTACKVDWVAKGPGQSQQVAAPASSQCPVLCLPLLAGLG